MSLHFSLGATERAQGKVLSRSGEREEEERACSRAGTAEHEVNCSCSSLMTVG